MNTIKLYGLLPLSRANGPGRRFVIWVQGCTLGCPGCFNPDSHPTEGGTTRTPESLFEEILTYEQRIEGITISGGEPFQQRAALLPLLAQIRQKTTLSVLLFSGYSWAEIQKMPDADTLLANVDVLIAGRYMQAQHIARSLKGSDNKTIHLLTNRYTIADLEQVPPLEIIINAHGDVIVSGIDADRLLPLRK